MKINLTGGDAQARSVIASAQRCLNLYTEVTDKNQGEPAVVTHYPTPGLTLKGVTPNGMPIRGMYRATNGDLYVVAGRVVYYVDPSLTFHSIGTMSATASLLPTKMADNGTNILLCDGSPFGYAINMVTRVMTSVAGVPDPDGSGAGWLGANFVDYSDTFFIANSPGTPIFYVSDSEATTFSPLQFASKSAFADVLVAAVVQHRVLWLIGQLSTEVWYDGGGVSASGALSADNFPFQIMPGVAMDWGCAAQYSIAKAETSIFWLAQNLNGETVVLKGNGYSVERISTHPLENVFSQYATVSDAIGYCYMQQGHSFYVLNFPTADATWAYDLATGQWAERCWLDTNGLEHAHRSTCHAFAYGANFVNDAQNGNLYALDLNNYTDNGNPIKRLVGFPRVIGAEDDNRAIFQSFTAEIDAGESVLPNDNPTITLRWSDDKGKTYSNGVTQPLGNVGAFKALVRWHRLGLSRNRVFRLEWSANAFVALQGAFVNVIKANS